MRFWRHLFTDRAHARRAFPAAALERIERAIADGETRHGGQVVFVVEPALPLSRVLAKLPPATRALEVFGLQRVWDTAHNNGVLVYLLLADRDVEVVADRGIHARVGEEAWREICRRMEAAFRADRYADGVVEGIGAINALLERHYPRDGDSGGNELADRPVLL
jgi:uncharacterized membrane protein